jgi:hypothetical protein
LGDVFEEADIRSGLKDGGQVLGAFIVARSEEEFVVYMRCNWIRGRGFRIIRSWRGLAGDRTFKHLQSAWGFIRKFNFLGRVTVYPAGDVELRQFVGVAPQDLVESSRLAGPAAGGGPLVSASTADQDSPVADKAPPAVSTTADRPPAASEDETPPLLATNPDAAVR